MNSSLSGHQHGQGTICRWNDERGFGFIRPSQTQEEIFFHISAFEGGGRPKDGERVYFVAERDGKRRKAIKVYSQDNPSKQQKQRIRKIERRQRAKERYARLSWKLFFSVLAFAAWFAIIALFMPKLLFAVDALLSLILFVMYVNDKNAALNGEWRTSEAQLHFFALIGGWPGALIARYMLNHKTVKTEFVITFWITVVLNIAAAIYLSTHPQLLSDTLPFLKNLLKTLL
ncbi:cold shock and DUF1294 domain-containing protein [Neisseria montereyensis]|uniref:Cold shock and DUF1294 domain-containing protein n=1 Tax=Neisseria montereyensis TaxID=2973938 RepID=A0ABT2F9U7_9NEIS|nr:cold shock and DUF1294 domain-containing protein [Neisseria montereyensis]MCS4532927.1 cold shock and DUF1294 domain-containing protein [Neisseria montereyensis]